MVCFELTWNVSLLQSFFGLGFGQNVDIDIVLDGQETRKTAEIRAEDGRKERHYLYLDGETISGKVCATLLHHSSSASSLLLFIS